MSTQSLTNLDYATIPVDSLEVSSYDPSGHDASKIMDGDLSTFWTPWTMEKSWVRINFFKPHLIREIDLAFHDGDKKRYVFEISVLYPNHGNNNNHWNSLNTYETRGDTTDPVRYNIPDIVTRAVKITFLSFTENDTEAMGIRPRVSEIRINGEIMEDELEDSKKIKKIKCPKGYVEDKSTGLCVMKGAVYDRLEPTVIMSKITEKIKNYPQDNLVTNVTDGNPDTGYTLYGTKSKITQMFNRDVDIYSVNIDIANSTAQSQYNFVLDFGKKQVPVLLQPDLISTEVVLDEPVRTHSVDLIFGATTDPSQSVTVTRMEVNGNPNPPPRE